MPAQAQFAVIFDMDGVIVDSNPYHAQAWVEFCKKYNVPLEEAEIPGLIFGKTNKAVLPEVFKREFSPEEADRLGEEKEAIYRKLHEKEMEPVKGLIPFLQMLKQNNIATAVATNAPVTNLDFTLKLTNTRQYFDVLIDATMVKEGKPSPDIYLRAAKELNMSPAQCIVMEDSTTGVEAGLRANMKVVAITTTHTPEELAHTSLVIDSFDELDMEVLNSLLQKTTKAGDQVVA